MGKLSVFDRTTQKSEMLVSKVQEHTNIEDPHKAFQAMRVIIQALRDRIPMEEAVHLGAQFPNLIAGYYYDGWKPSSTPTKERTLQEFLTPIRDQLQEIDPQLDAEHSVRGVFRVLNEVVSEGEIDDIIKALPSELRELWPEQEVKK